MMLGAAAAGKGVRPESPSGRAPQVVFLGKTEFRGAAHSAGAHRRPLRPRFVTGWLKTNFPSGRGTSGDGSRSSRARFSTSICRGARSLRRFWWPLRLTETIFICRSTLLDVVNLLIIFARAFPGSAFRERPTRPWGAMVTAAAAAACAGAGAEVRGSAGKSAELSLLSSGRASSNLVFNKVSSPGCSVSPPRLWQI